MLEAYYWTRTFKFSHRELELIELFLASDMFNLGRTAAYYTRHLHIQIQPFENAALICPRTAQIEEGRCLRAIAALAAIETARTEVLVHFDLNHTLTESLEAGHLRAAAEPLLLKMTSALVALKAKGLRIEIAISGSWDEGTAMRVRSNSICSPEDCIGRIATAAHCLYPDEVM